MAAVTILLTAPALSAIAGPFILPEAKAIRFATGIWVSHGLLFLCMGYAAGASARVRGAVLGAVMAALAGVAAGLFYAQAHLLPAGPATIGGLAALGLVCGLVGGGAGAAVPGSGLWAVLVWAVVGGCLLCGAFVQAGVVGGKVTRTVSVVVQGMTTAQKDVPVAGIEVVLCTADGKTRLYQTRTNADGDYCINGPRPGTYTLWAYDNEPGRGSGRWVSQRVQAHGHLTGQGLHAGNLTLPGYRDVQVRPFVEDEGTSAAPVPGTPATASPAGAGQTGGGTQGQMERLLKDAMGGGR
jgi:hypothetical protein